MSETSLSVLQWPEQRPAVIPSQLCHTHFWHTLCRLLWSAILHTNLTNSHWTCVSAQEMTHCGSFTQPACKVNKGRLLHWKFLALMRLKQLKQRFRSKSLRNIRGHFLKMNFWYNVCFLTSTATHIGMPYLNNEACATVIFTFAFSILSCTGFAGSECNKRMRMWDMSIL